MEENGKYSWSMSGDSIFRHNEAHSTIPMKDVDVMRQTRTIIDDGSEHTRNDCWNDEIEVLLSEECNWNNSFPKFEDHASQKGAKG